MEIKIKVDDVGRLLIPKKIRDALGLINGQSCIMIVNENEIIIRKGK